MFLVICALIVIVCVLILVGQKRRRNAESNVEIPKEDSVTDRDKRFKELRLKQETNSRAFEVCYPYVSCYKALKRIEDPYFTYLKPINILRENLKIITCLPQDEFLKIGIKEAKKMYSDETGFVISAYILRLMDDPKQFLIDLNNFHKITIIDSIDSFHYIWKTRVRNLQRISAKTKRKVYVLEGYQEMKKELLKLEPSALELEKLENKIEEINNENWEMI